MVSLMRSGRGRYPHVLGWRVQVWERKVGVSKRGEKLYRSILEGN